jgi:hypothetical protein
MNEHESEPVHLSAGTPVRVIEPHASLTWDGWVAGIEAHASIEPNPYGTSGRPVATLDLLLALAAWLAPPDRIRTGPYADRADLTGWLRSTAPGPPIVGPVTFGLGFELTVPHLVVSSWTTAPHEAPEVANDPTLGRRPTYLQRIDIELAAHYTSAGFITATTAGPG